MLNLSAELAQRQRDSLYRHRRTLDSATGTRALIDGREYLAFCSNDYLGLANHPDVVAALRQGAERWGAGSGASHLVSGHSRAHQALEEELADFLGRPRALLFSTGYMANLGTIAALCRRGDTLFEDRLNHASLLDAARLSQARLQRYRHNDASALAARLAQQQGATRLVASDGVFSMDGDIAPLPELAHCAAQHGAWLMVDDAHGIGVIGRQGRGTLDHFGLKCADCPILMGTLGKAFGTFGAFVAGSDELIEYLIQHARTYIYTTALPAAVAEATRTSLRLLQSQEWRREQLQARIAQFRRGAAELGLTLLDSTTPIQPLLIGDSARTVAVNEKLLARGLLVGAIRPPTVPAGTARLRITLSADHSEQQIDQLLEALEAST